MVDLIFKNDCKIYVICIIMSVSCLAFHKKVPIGGFFDDDEMIQKAFEAAVRAVNNNGITFKDATEIHLVPKVQSVEEDIYELSEKACALLRSGVAAIFGPQGKEAISYVQSVCDSMDIPCISTRWCPDKMRENIINLYPKADMLTAVFNEIITKYEWEDYAILYENSDRLIQANRLLSLGRNTNATMALYHLGSGPDFRKVLKEIKHDQHVNIIIDCSVHILAEVLLQAQQVGITSRKHKWIIASLDFPNIDLERYQYSGVNITGTSLINRHDSVVKDIFKNHFYDFDVEDVSELKVDAALMFDAVTLFAQGFTRLRHTIEGNVKRLTCDGNDTWEHGGSLSNLIRAEEIYGLTGKVKFDPTGYRSDFYLDILSLTKEGLTKIGQWRGIEGLHWLPWEKPPENEEEKKLQNKNFIVLISLTEPYGMFRESVTTVTGNDRYEGFAIDIIKELSHVLGFNYTFKVQEDNKYGSFDPKTEEWDGMIGRIMDGEADLAITDLTINKNRADAVDFTTPFMNLGISVLYRIPNKAPPSLISFLMPFSRPVWNALILVYIFSSVLLFILGRTNPAEWNNPIPCIEEPEYLENQISLNNSFWCTIGSLMQQGTEIAPVGVSTRTIVTAWWFFSLLITTTYTANLAAFLTAKVTIWPFQEAEELAYQNKIKYGAKKGGSTYTFFENSTYPPYKRMYEVMRDNENELMQSSNENGLKKVMNEDYAFFMESTSIEYFTQRFCNVTQVGDLLDEKSYGIAMRKGAEYRNDLTTALLNLKESGVITQLKVRWWEEKRGGDTCMQKEAQSALALDLEDVGGVFIFFVAGVVLSTFYTLGELLAHVWSTSRKKKISFGKQLGIELEFLCSGCKMKRVVKRQGSCIKLDSEE